MNSNNYYLIQGTNKSSKDYFHKLGYLVLMLNVLAIAYGAFYIIKSHSSWLWNICGGVIILSTLVMNFILVHLRGKEVREGSRLVKVIRILGYIYLIIVIVAMFNMLIGNITLSNSYSSNIEDNINLYYVIYFSYFIIFIMGGIIAYLNTLNITSDFSSNGKMNRIKIVGWLIKPLCYLSLFCGILIAYVILSKSYTWNLEIFISQFALFFGSIFLSIAIILLNLKSNKKGVSYYIVAVIGIGIFVICFLPLALTPYTIMKAEKSFNELYGKEWRGKISKEAEEYFLNTQFNIPSYFLGIKSKNYTVKKDILFYKGRDINGKEVKLYFDVYKPNNLKQELPGKDHTIIRIHGGAWVAGDKGELNVLQMNKYLAEQGYTVFDIQYGLSDNSNFTIELGEPEHVKGNFKVDDMINHIGTFTKYIDNHAMEYNINLENVFISGSSAGGHLAAAAGLAINNEEYKNIFSPKIKVKGVILYYPANGLPSLGNIEGDSKLLNPELLVQKNSPPCLIYQGTRDGMVPQDVAKKFSDKYYEQGNKNCTILWMALGSHGSDCYFPGNYNQVFLYYMERFMYINSI